MKSLQYIFGCIVHKLHSKFCYNWNQSDTHGVWVSDWFHVLVLKSCKIDADDSQTLVNVKDKGGLWKVNQKRWIFCKMWKNILSLFSIKNVSSNLFRLYVKCTVLSNFKLICDEIDLKVEKEVCMIVLEHLLTLFVKVRIFLYAKDICENKNKATKRKNNKCSLRTELEKTSITADMDYWTTKSPGHGLKNLLKKLFL